MVLEEAAAWLDGDLVLPIGGKKYRVPEPSAELGMRLEVILNAGTSLSQDGTLAPESLTERQRQLLSDEEEHDTYRDVLGPAFDQMIAGGVSWPRLKHAAVTAMFHFVISPQAAETYWNRGVQAGKAASRSSRPATRGTTAAARTTKPRASGSGTRSPRSS